MARGGRVGYKRKTRNKIQLEKNGSDDSDEDYKVDEDEFDLSEDEYCSSLAEDESEESLGEFEEEWVEKKARRPRGRKTFQARKNNGLMKPRKKKVAYREEEEVEEEEEEEEEEEDDDDDDDDDDDYEENYDDDDFAYVNHRKKIKVSHKEEEDDDMEILHRQNEDEFVDEKPINESLVSRSDIYVNTCNENPRKKNKVSYREGNGDGNSDDLDDEDDEEFTPVEVLKGTRRRKPYKKQVKRRNNRSVLSKEFIDENPPLQKRKMISRRRRKTVVNSDSDFVSSGSSDFEYTISEEKSEEEREQVRQATEFCSRLSTSLRSSTSSKMIKEEEILPPQRKRLARKGKEKVVDTKIELVKQVCGICLSEEGKRTVKGALNCCSHYFCFACIMEWSKVESRCPLCKQRFTTINRTTRVDGGNDLTDAVFPVPERDQVYQPSEEELRGFLDPYENVLCTECHQGGDDAFMLLCDLCDSPAHTYCVGLGREVPDGNWYCDGCRPTLASSNSQGLNPTPDNGASNNLCIGSSPVTAVRETFDLNEVYVPDTPLTEHSQSPRTSVGDSQAASPASGSGAFTLLERRRIQRQIHQMLNIRSRQSDRSDSVGPPSAGINLFGSPIGRGGVIAPQPDFMSARTPQRNIYLNQRLPHYNTPTLYGREVLSPRLSSLRGQALGNQASTSSNHSFGGLLNSEIGGINARVGGGLGHQQLHPCNGRSNTGTGASTSPYQFREATVPSSRTLQGSLHTPF